MTTLRAVFLCALTTALVACGDGNPVEPPRTRQLRIVRGEGEGDTVRSRTPDTLTVEVRGENGRLVTGALVQFKVIPRPASTRELETGIVVCALSAMGCSSDAIPVPETLKFLTAATGADGRASILVGYGTYAGPSNVAIEVPTLELADTVGFTVLPGAPSNLALDPQDTLLLADRTFRLRSVVTDRFGNVRGDPITITSTSPAIVSVDGTQATSRAPGRVQIRASSGTLNQVTFVTVVPSGIVAWADNSGVYTSAFDGTQRKKWAPSGHSPMWIPGEDALLFATDDERGAARIATVDAAGTITFINVDRSRTSGDFFARITADRQWIYFSGRGTTGDRTFQLYRIRRDGMNQERLMPDDLYTDWRGDLSPDETRIAYMSTRAGYNDVRVLNIATRAVTVLNARGTSPMWSPDGTQIAYTYMAALWVINPDGSGGRRVSLAGKGYSDHVDWTADGKWLVSSNATGIVLVEVATGTEIRSSATTSPNVIPIVKN